MQAHQVIRERLRRELEKRSLSAVELARIAGVKNSFIYDILNGKSTNPSIVKLAMVAEALGVSLSYLAGMVEGAAASGRMMDLVAIPPLGGGKKKGADYHYFPRAWLLEGVCNNPDHLRTLIVEGESMAPTLHNKDLLLVDTSRISPSPPGIFVLSDGVGLVPKRLEFAGNGTPPLVRINADNAQYSSYERSLHELNILGRIVWFARQI